MNQVLEFFSKLFDISDWPPRWHCGRWTEFHGWFFIVSDLLIWSAYFCIPLLIIRFVSKRKDARFHRIYFLFAGFILACGSTHFLDAVMFWFPAYRINALVKFITGVISWITVFNLVRILPKAFTLKSAEELEAEVEQRKAAEEALIQKNQQLNEAHALAKLGHWEYDIGTQSLKWSNNLYRIFGMDPEKDVLSIEGIFNRTIEEDKMFIRNNMKKVFVTGLFPENYVRIRMADGSVNTLHTKGQVVLDENHKVTRILGTAQDVTELKRSEMELMLKSKNLEATNAELQKFAYIASHDLQEPLRKIITFSSMLQKEAGELMPAKAQGYLTKVMDATERMQVLINDILDFSQVSAETGGFSQVSLNLVINQVISDLEISIQETQALINVDKLPDIDAIESQMGQLFQNLISNSIKFRKSGVAPEISIYAEIVSGEFVNTNKRSFSVLGNPKFWENSQFCNIYVKDNGIGFDAAYVDRIFNIFQRLHSRSTFEGTGIGLAICKKIVANHNGQITAKSKDAEGATFVITLPISQVTYGFKE